MKTQPEITDERMLMKMIDHARNDSGAGSLRQAMTHAGTALIESRRRSSVSRLAYSFALLLLFSLVWPAQAQTPCPGSESCTGLVAQMVCPDPGTTLFGNDVIFTWCNAGADYFL